MLYHHHVIFLNTIAACQFLDTSCSDSHKHSRTSKAIYVSHTIFTACRTRRFQQLEGFCEYSLSQICEHGPWFCFPLIKIKSLLVINPVSSRCLEVQRFVLCHQHGMFKAADSRNAVGTKVTREVTLMTRETSCS